MIDIDLLELLFFTSTITSTLSLSLTQKTKHFIKKSKYIPAYNGIVNLLLGYFFCLSFLKIKCPLCMWVGIFGFIGSDSLYKKLEGNLKRHSELRNEKEI